MPIYKTIVTAVTFLTLLTSTNNAFSIDIKQSTQIQTKSGGVLNVRYGPGKRKINTIKSGTPVQVLKTVGSGRNKWSRIKWAGKIGWVSSDFIKKVATVDTSKTYQVNATSLNVRKGAGRNTAKLRGLPRGTSGIKILKVSDVGGTYWANISQGGKKGWVSAQFLKVAANKPVSSGGGTSTDTQKQYYTVVSGDSLYGIQRKTKKYWKTIAELNNIKAPYALTLGQKLQLP